jgi:hypothetical protein
MNETDRPTPEPPETPEVEGHRVRWNVDAERDGTDDVEGHGRRFVRTDAERDETDGTDDVEGHRRARF